MTTKERKPEPSDREGKEPYEPPALTRHGNVVTITGTSAVKEVDGTGIENTGKGFEGKGAL